MANAVRVSVLADDIKKKRHIDYTPDVSILISIWKKKLKRIGLVKILQSKQYHITKGEKRRTMKKHGKARALKQQQKAQGGDNE